MATPAWNLWLDSVWGPGYEGGYPPIPAAASNVTIGTNPAYTLQDFLAIYPRFGGPPINPAPTATIVDGSNQITVSAATGIAVGNPVAGAGIPDGTVVTAISGTTVTLSAESTADGSDVAVTIWNTPLLPFAVLALYVAFASSCVNQNRWLDMWPLAMALFIAHFATLYLMTDGATSQTVSQAASQGLALGAAVSKSVGDVSVSYQLPQGIEDWGAWTLTAYGQQFATMAKAVGSGPMFLW